jgi:hypothetical protein
MRTIIIPGIPFDVYYRGSLNTRGMVAITVDYGTGKFDHTTEDGWEMEYPGWSFRKVGE